MAAAIGSDLPGQPPPYSVDDDVALLQPGDDVTDQSLIDPGKVQSFPAPAVNQPMQVQSQMQGYAYPPPSGYYGQPVLSMPAYNPQVEHHQQQTTVVVSGHIQQQAYLNVPMESYGGMMALSCFVMWCCNFVFGLVAFILAAQADSIKYDNRESARRLGRASMWVSIAGVIVAVIVIGILVAVVLTNPQQNSTKQHYYGG